MPTHPPRPYLSARRRAAERLQRAHSAYLEARLHLAGTRPSSEAQRVALSRTARDLDAAERAAARLMGWPGQTGPGQTAGPLGLPSDGGDRG